jgi:hypothetical protein
MIREENRRHDMRLDDSAIIVRVRRSATANAGNDSTGEAAPLPRVHTLGGPAHIRRVRLRQAVIRIPRLLPDADAEEVCA